MVTAMTKTDWYHERCLKCRWLAPDLKPPCGRIFHAQIAVSPKGGTVDISFTPGMVPVEMEEDFKHMLGRVFGQVEIVIQAWPGWDQLGELMRLNPDKDSCPGRNAMDNQYLRIVK
jgi:hypothetical protein